MLPVENYRLSRLIQQERIQPAVAPQRSPRGPEDAALTPLWWLLLSALLRMSCR
jgi:hypothetical protein